MNGVYVCGEVCCPPLYVSHLCRALLCKQTRVTYPKRQAAPKTTACDILLHPGYPFTPFNSVQLRSKGGWSFSRRYRTGLAGSALTPTVKTSAFRAQKKDPYFVPLGEGDFVLYGPGMGAEILRSGVSRSGFYETAAFRLAISPLVQRCFYIDIFILCYTI